MMTMKRTKINKKEPSKVPFFVTLKERRK